MFNETWSYRSWQERPSVEDKVAEKIHDLLKVVGAGGNYLLNIGPKGDGTVIPFEKQVLAGIGTWLEKNGESIYGTKASTFPEQEWGVITTKPGKIYLHVIDYPKDNKLEIKGLNTTIKNVYPLTEPMISLGSKKSDRGYELDLTSGITQDKYATTIVLEYEGALSIMPLQVIEANENNEFLLTSENAEKFHSYSGHDYYSTKATVIKMKWYVSKSSKGISEMKITLNSAENNMFKLVINNQEYAMSPSITDTSQKSDLYQFTIPAGKLTQNINEIELSLADQSNPHKGIMINGLKIHFN